MGYKLIIGNAKLNIDKEYGYATVEAEGFRDDSAPAFNEPTDYTSERWPSYTSWHDAMRFLGLYNLFFDKESEPLCLINQHSGCVTITKHHKEQIDIAYLNFYKKYPNAKAGYSPKADDFSIDPDWPLENNYATRLEWLKFWVDYVMVNCEHPVFYNS